MTRCRAVLAVEAVALLVVLAWALAQPVTATRGRDEIDYRHLQPFPMQVGQSVSQPVPLQQDQLSGIVILYQLLSPQPAEIRVLVQDANGRTLLDAREQVQPSKPLAFRPVPIDGRDAISPLLLTIERTDQGSGQLDLEVFPTPGSGRPSAATTPGNTLGVQTLYGAWRPALRKVPLYAARLESLAAPWLRGPAAVVFTALLVVLGLALVAALATRSMAQDGSTVPSDGLAVTDAPARPDPHPRVL